MVAISAQNVLAQTCPDLGGTWTVTESVTLTTKITYTPTGESETETETETDTGTIVMTQEGCTVRYSQSFPIPGGTFEAERVGTIEGNTVTFIGIAAVPATGTTCSKNSLVAVGTIDGNRIDATTTVDVACTIPDFVVTITGDGTAVFSRIGIPPVAVTNAASSISQTGATLNGTADPNNSSTSAWFQWGTTTSYGQTTSSVSVGSGNSPVGFNYTISGLSCGGTTYHFRAVANNAVGADYGSDRSFTTVECSGTSAEDFVTTWKTDNPGTSIATSITVPMVGGPYDVDWDSDGTFDEFGIIGSVTHDYEIAGTNTIRIRGIYDAIRFNNGGDKEKILSIDQWGTQSWTSMERAFYGAVNLQVPATDTPDFSAVTDMSYMFYQAYSANPDTSGWNTSAVTTMAWMFADAATFDQDIGSWNVTALLDATDMFDGVTLSTENYNSLLVGWNAQALQVGVTFDGGNSNYCSAAAVTARANMIESDSWVITDGGKDCTTTLQMNVGLNDAWYSPVTNGQGFFITVFPDIGYVSLSWFTYDTMRPGESVTANLGEPGHRWLMALGTYSGNQAVMDISITSGGIFDTPTEVTEVDDGTMILTFTDCENGTIEYDIPSINQQGTVPIQRVVGDNIALCEAFAEQAATQKNNVTQKINTNSTISSDTPVTAIEPTPLVDMNVGLNDAWYYPVTNGQGFFITVFPDIGYVSLSWFTYDTVRPDESATANLGEPGHRWLMALGTYSGNQAVMDISITSGGIFDTPTEVTEVNDGTIILTFTDCESGTIEYDIPSIDQKGTVPIQRVVGDNIALCEALNTD